MIEQFDRRGPEGNIYGRTVELLRDLSRNHASAAADMCMSVEHADGAETAVAALGAMLEGLEDVALRAICGLARATCEESVFRAIDEAEAGWLRAVIINRAVGTAFEHN
jgi:hypothetical protein